MNGRRRFLRKTVAIGVSLAIAGCLSTSGDSDGSGNLDLGDQSEYDFGGETISVMLNAGKSGSVIQKSIIPKVEEKYNLNIDSEMGVTTNQLTKIEANPENPPDAISPDVIGIAKAYKEDWLVDLSEYPDLVPNYEKIYDKFQHYDNTAASYFLSEICPFINTDKWDSKPETWADVAKNANEITLVPFSWSGGPYILMIASAIATGKDFSSPDLDVEAGFEWLEENLAPNVKTTYGGVEQANQALVNGNVDTIYPHWAYNGTEMLLETENVDIVRRPQPAAIPVAGTMAVTKNASNKEAALLYVNEVLSAAAQEEMSSQILAGVTNKDATVAEDAKKLDVATAEDFDQFQFPDFERIQNNRSDWAVRWDEIFG